MSAAAVKGTPVTIGGDHGILTDDGKFIPGGRRNKFNAERAASTLTRRRYDSGLERDVAEHLCARLAAGEISDLRQQDRVLLVADIWFKVDFSFTERGRRVYVEAKGFPTERWRLIQKLWRTFGPGPLTVIQRGRRGGLSIAKQILPKGGSA